VIAGGFTLTFWSRPTGGIVVGTALVALVLVGIVELLARPPEAVRVTDTVPDATAAPPSADAADASLPPQPADNGEKLPAGHRT
jgi:hypothetical protein